MAPLDRRLIFRERTPTRMRLLTTLHLFPHKFRHLPQVSAHLRVQVQVVVAPVGQTKSTRILPVCLPIVTMVKIHSETSARCVTGTRKRVCWQHRRQDLGPKIIPSNYSSNNRVRMQSSRFSPSEERGGWVDGVMLIYRWKLTWIVNFCLPLRVSDICCCIYFLFSLLLVKFSDTKFYTPDIVLILSLAELQGS